MSYPAGYPAIVDWEDYSRRLLPDLAAAGDGAAMSRRLTEPLRDIDDRLATLHAGLVEIEDAQGGTLDLLGDDVDEPRQGLSDLLYRRLIAGRRVARSGGTTRPQVYAGWVALSGSGEATAEELGASSVLLRAAIDFTPTSVWLVRAADVVRDLMGTGYQCTALLTTSSTAIYDDPGTPFGVGQWAYQLPVLGAS